MGPQNEAPSKQTVFEFSGNEIRRPKSGFEQLVAFTISQNENRAGNAANQRGLLGQCFHRLGPARSFPDERNLRLDFDLYGGVTLEVVTENAQCVFAHLFTSK